MLDIVQKTFDIYWLASVKPSLCLWDEVNLIIVNDHCDHFDALLGSVCKYFTENFLYLRHNIFIDLGIRVLMTLLKVW